MYYNFFAPSTIGGDVLQAETAKRYIGGRMHSYVTILLNRFIALFAVSVLAILFIGVDYFALDELSPALTYVAIIMTVSVGGAFLGFFYYRKSMFPSRLGQAKSESRFWVSGVRDCLLEYLDKKQVIGKVFLLAIVSNLVGQVLVVWIIADGIGLDISAFYHFLFVPVIILVTLVPITLNGIGLRETAFIYFYTGEGVAANDAVAMSVVFTGLLVAFGLVGGLATLSPRYRLSLK